MYVLSCRDRVVAAGAKLKVCVCVLSCRDRVVAAGARLKVCVCVLSCRDRVVAAGAAVLWPPGGHTGALHL